PTHPLGLPGAALQAHGTRARVRHVGRRARARYLARMADTERDLTRDDPLDDFDARELTFLGQTKRVFVAGKGPAVIVMAEIPGIYPHVARFARWVRAAGFTVWMPNLFG